MNPGLNSEVKVSLWTVLMAIRYGMGRQTFANVDASILAQIYWQDFPEETRRQIQSDANMLEGIERDAWWWILEGQELFENNNEEIIEDRVVRARFTDWERQ